jgi:acid phosphatase type 7
MKKTNHNIQLKRKIAIALISVFSLMLNQNVSFASDNHTPERIILNLGENTSTSQPVSWRTGIGIDSVRAQITLALSNPNLHENPNEVFAVSEKIKINEKKSVLQHSVTFNDLVPNTLYAYRVGDGNVWSEWNQFKTAHEEEHPFKFVYFGDSQNRIKEYCSRIFRAAYTKAPDASFWHIAGDIVNRGGSDTEWGELYEAFGWVSRITPLMLLPGNHEYIKTKVGEKQVRVLTSLWRPQFTMPENGPDGLEETVYYVDYQGTRFVMLNGNEKLDEQATWLNEILAQNPNQWTIAAIHQPFYSMTERRDNPHLRERFVPLFDKYGVDLVLQGHDHSYGRTHKLLDNEVVSEEKKGTVYVVSVSGPKQYTPNPKFAHLMAKIGSDVQLFQVISIDSYSIKYESWTATGELYDSFELKKYEKNLEIGE